MADKRKRIRRDGLVSLRHAARAVGKRYETIKAMVKDREIIAIRDGGTDESPWLVVSVEAVKAALRARVYNPPQPVPTEKRIPSKKLHRLVQC